MVFEVLVFLSYFLVLFCFEMKDEDGLDFKYKCNNLGEIDVLFYELNCLFFLEICVIIGEKKNEVLMECKVKFVGSLLFKFLDKEEYE